MYIKSLVTIFICSNIHQSGSRPRYSRNSEGKYSEDASYWKTLGNLDLEKTLKVQSMRNEGRARNIIFFVGDGMGIQTHTMARIYKGQKRGESGEEGSLVWEEFPSTGIIKTYNTDSQVADSAGTATAMFTGVKTKIGLVGVDNRATYNICDPSVLERSSVESLADWGNAIGKEVGIVTTARVTHATPAAMYAHSPMRNWESDADLPQTNSGCKDIASQLVESVESGKIKLVMGGGRRGFRKVHQKGGRRLDADLVERLLDIDGLDYLETTKELRRYGAYNVINNNSVVGLFSQSHMDYEVDRNVEDDGQPSLTEMTQMAIQRLDREDNKGFILMVEAGRVDHGHHENRVKMALEETLQLEKAVEAALKLTNSADTLILVTADHSHAVTMSGYPERGNNILGLVHDPSKGYVVTDPVTGLTQPYTTIGYANGPGYDYHWDDKRGFWRNLTNDDYTKDDFVQMATFNADDETHGGEDVTVYAVGPQAHLVSGVHEQSYLAHLVSYAGCLKKDHKLGCPPLG